MHMLVPRLAKAAAKRPDPSLRIVLFYRILTIHLFCSNKNFAACLSCEAPDATCVPDQIVPTMPLLIQLAPERHNRATLGSITFRKPPPICTAI